VRAFQRRLRGRCRGNARRLSVAFGGVVQIDSSLGHT